MFQTDFDRASDLVLVQDRAGRARSASSTYGRGTTSDPAVALVLDTGPIEMARGWWAFCAEARATGTGSAGARV